MHSQQYGTQRKAECQELKVHTVHQVWHSAINYIILQV